MLASVFASPARTSCSAPGRWPRRTCSCSSGVGLQEPLRALGLPLVQHLPGVGQNMRDHPNVQVRLRLKPEVPEDDIARRRAPAYRCGLQHAQ